MILGDNADITKLRLITTKPVIYLINLTMKDYLRQKCKYLPKIAEWVKAHGGEGSDIIPFSVEFEEKLWSLRDDKPALDAFMAEIKVQSRLGKITNEGTCPKHSCHTPHINSAGRFQQARPAVLLHRWREGDPLLADQAGNTRPTGGGCHPR